MTRKMPIHMEEQIIKLYLEGLSTSEIGKRIDKNRSLVLNILKRNNIQLRKKHITEDTKKEIADLYQEQQLSTQKIAKKLNISPAGVYHILKLRQVKMRNRAEGRSKTRKYEREIIELYQRGYSTREISQKFSVSDSAIKKVFYRNSLEMRRRNKRISIELKKQIIEMGLTGYTVLEIRNRLGNEYDYKFIRGVLERNKIKIKRTTAIITKEIEEESVKLYQENISTLDIAKKLNVSITSVGNILHKYNIHARNPSERGILSSKKLSKDFFRKRIISQYKSGQFPRQTNTNIENIIHEELIKRGFIENRDFIHQYNLNNKFTCDFCFPKHKLIIECDGDYWHANPSKYSDNLEPIQKKMIRRDKSKDGYIRTIDNSSWTLLRFWESDIEKDVSKCVDKIENIIRTRIEAKAE